MATTTNYGWTTPDDTALVKDGASAIRSLGTAVDTTTKNLNPSTTLGDIEYRSSTANTNTRLGIGSSGQVLTVAAGVPSWATPSTYTSPLTTKGDLFTRTSSADARLAVGTNGYILVADSAETTGLKWAAPAAGGKVLQVVEATTTTSVTNSTATYDDTTLTATITPSSASSKILVLVNQNGCHKTAQDTGNNLQLRLLRGATSLVEVYALYTNTALIQEGCVSISKLDSPNTTSATTYKTQFNNARGVAAVKVQADGSKSTIVLMEIGA